MTIPIEPVRDVEQVTGEMVEDRLGQVIAEAQARAPEENLDELDRLAGRLERVSSTESVDELAVTLQRMTGAKARATEPAATTVDGPFDFQTAQLYFVRRADPANESFPYIAILLDADGRTMEVQMTAAEGEAGYQTFQRLKRFPLAERIYRQFTMSLLDGLVRSA